MGRRRAVAVSVMAVSEQSAAKKQGKKKPEGSRRDVRGRRGTMGAWASGVERAGFSKPWKDGRTAAVALTVCSLVDKEPWGGGRRGEEGEGRRESECGQGNWWLHANFGLGEGGSLVFCAVRGPAMVIEPLCRLRTWFQLARTPRVGLWCGVVWCGWRARARAQPHMGRLVAGTGGLGMGTAQHSTARHCTASASPQTLPVAGQRVQPARVHVRSRSSGVCIDTQHVYSV